MLAALVELGAELQRKRLKDDYRNGRELCTTGLWGVVRRPHFACNVVHGAAYGVAAGGGVAVFGSAAGHVSGGGGMEVTSRGLLRS